MAEGVTASLQNQSVLIGLITHLIYLIFALPLKMP